MNKLIEFSVSNGTVIVESQEAETGRATRGGMLEQVTQNVGKSFLDSLSVISPVAEATMAACRGLANSLDAVEVEFGLKFVAGLDAVIATGSGEGNIRIKLFLKPK